MALVFDLVDPTDLVGYIRGLAYEQNLYRFVLSQFLPEQEVMDTEFRFYRGNLQDQDSATYRSFDTESPIAARLTGTRVVGEIPPLSRKIRLGEEERLRLRVAETSDQTALVDAIYNDAANMTRAVLIRLERARGEALHSGMLTLSENGVTATIDFGRRAAHSVAPATLWSDRTNADPISDLQTWQTTYTTNNGIPAAFALISTTTLGNLLGNVKVQRLAQSLSGIPSLVSRAQLDQTIQDFGLPQLLVNDEQVRIDGVASRIIPANKVVLLPPLDEPLGNTIYGITADALALQSAGYIVQDQLPGIVSVVMSQADPVSTWTKASGLAIPLVANPDLTFTATVA